MFDYNRAFVTRTTMMNENFTNGDSVCLPATAVAIKVTNVLNPYVIRIHEVKGHTEKVDSIGKKLSLIGQRKTFDVETTDTEAISGNHVVVRHNLDRDVDVPGWWCRGIVCSCIDAVKQKYNVFLVDYGNCVQLLREDFAIVPSNLISDSHLSFTVGLYNVLPASMQQDSLKNKGNSLLIMEEWSDSAIRFTKELITAANAVYFSELACDEYGKQYGELYLIIEERIISLREALVLNSYAIYLGRELLNLLNEPRTYGQRDKEIVDDETIYSLNVSRDQKIFKERTKSNIKDTGTFKKQKYSISQLDKERQKILIYGRIKCDCLTSVSDAKFPTAIHNAWNSLVQSSRPKKIQSYIWPAIKKGLDVIAIGTAKSGKTFGCVVAVTGLLVSLPSLPPGANPSALILCSSSSGVLQVHSLCTEFLQSYGSIKSVAAINGKSERSVTAELFNGCQILVSTPRYLAWFIDRNRKLLKFEKLRHLILDDADVILDKYYDSISQLFKKHKVIHNRESKDNNTILQITMTARHCTQILTKTMFVLMKNPYICIASFIEAAIFKSVRPKMYITNSKSKHKTVSDLLGDEYIKSRTMIVCLTSQEAEELNTFLSVDKKTLLAHENMNLIDLQVIKQCWKACITGSYPVLISTDQVLSDMDITNVQWLIHYSISLHSKTHFNYRFSTLLDSLQMEKSACKVTIMANENNDVQFQSVIKIMKRMNVVINEDMLKNIERIAATLDRKKENYPICDSLKSLGFCPRKSSCMFRHCILPEIDSPKTTIGINDKVKFMVICVHDAAHVSARIISYVKSDTQEEIQFSTMEYMQLSIKMEEFYSCMENRRRCDTVNVGDICALEESVDSFKRIQVLRIESIEKNHLNNPKFADVRCIDSGVILTKVNIYRLLYIPEELANLPTQVVEVFLTGIAPHDDEYTWNHCAVNVVHEWFRENISEKSYVIGTVHLHLGNTIWVDTLEIGTKLRGYQDLIGSSLKAELLEKDHAILNDKHMREMYKLCKDGGLKEINGYDLSLLINKSA